MKLKNKLFKKKSVLLATLGTILAPVVLSACSTQTSKDAEVKTSKDSVVFSLTDPENPRWIKATKELKENLQKYKGSDDLPYTVFENQSAKQEDQNAFINAQLVKQGIKAVVLGEKTNAAEIVDAINAKGIPVVAYDRLINGTKNYKYYATYDTKAVGIIQGLHLAAFILGQDKPFATMEVFDKYLTDNKTKIESMTEEAYFIPLQGDPADNNAEIFFNGAMEVMNKLTNLTKGKIKAVASFETNKLDELYKKTGATGSEKWETASDAFTKVANPDWSYDKAKIKVETAISTNAFDSSKNKLKGILAANDGMARSAIQALQSKNIEIKDKIYITGQDANDYGIQYIKDGLQGMTIHKPDNILSQVVAAVVNELIKNKDITPTDLDKNIRASAELKDKDFIKTLLFLGDSDAKNIYKPKIEKTGANDDADLEQTNATPTQSGATVYQTKKAVNTWLLNPVAITKENADQPL